jgi:membrane-anchored glycerophosphoryl diester phosphodiesterase (GDPDase)
MPQPLYPPSSPQTIGQVLDSGFHIFQLSFVSCILYGAVSMIAGQLPNIYFIASGRPLGGFGGGSVLWVVLYLIGSLITLTMYAAILYRQYGLAVGERSGMRVELKRSLRKLPGYLGVVVLSMVMCFIVPAIVAVALVAAGVNLKQPSPAVILLGLLMLIPITYLLTPLSFTTPALLLDGKGPAGAIRYAMRLARGSWWRMSAVLAITFVLIMVFYGVAMIMVGMILPLAGATDVAAVTAATGVVYVVLGSVGLPFFTAVLLAAYGELKVRREGIDLERRVATIASS